MDEATSSLDNISEKMIGRALSECANHMTLIQIAHRLTTVKNSGQGSMYLIMVLWWKKARMSSFCKTKIIITGCGMKYRIIHVRSRTYLEDAMKTYKAIIYTALNEKILYLPAVNYYFGLAEALIAQWQIVNINGHGKNWIAF